MNNPIDFRTSSYFSGMIYFLGILLVIVSGPVAFQSLIAGAVLVLAGVVILTTHYRLSIDFSKKEFHDYLWILGLKYGEKAKFEKIEYLFIKKSNVSQVMRSQVQSTTFRKEVFDGYLKFSEEEKIHLITRGNKNDLIKGLRVIATKLNVKIVDYSEGMGKVI